MRRLLVMFTRPTSHDYSFIKWDTHVLFGESKIIYAMTYWERQNEFYGYERNKIYNVYTFFTASAHS